MSGPGTHAQVSIRVPGKTTKDGKKKKIIKVVVKKTGIESTRTTIFRGSLGWAVMLGKKWVSIHDEGLCWSYIGNVDSGSEEE